MKWWCFCLALVVVQWPTVNTMPSAPNESGNASIGASPDDDSQSTPVIPLPQSSIPQARASTPEPDSSISEVDNSDNELGISGNWIKKKDIVLQAYDLYDEINGISIEIQGARQKFNEAYSSIDNDLDAFYKKFGIEQGKIQELFTSILTHLEHKKKRKQEELSKQRDANTLKERDYIINAGILEEEISKHEKSLEQLKLDLKSIEELDTSLTARLKKLNEVTNQAMQLAANAKTKIEKLWDILDHNKARTIYFEVKGNDFEKIKNIDTYLNNDLIEDFQKVSQTIRTQIQSVDTRATELEKAGFFIKNRAENVEKARAVKLAKAAEEAAKAATQAPVKKKIVIQRTWYESIYDSIIGFIADTIYFFKNLFSPAPVAMAVKRPRPTQPTPAALPLVPVSTPAQPIPQPTSSIPMQAVNQIPVQPTLQAQLPSSATLPQVPGGMPMASTDNNDNA